MTPVPFDLITAVTFTVYAALMYFGGSYLSRNEDDSFQNLALVFITIPFLAGYIGTSNDSYLAGSVACGIASLTLTTLLGNLSLKTCLILALATPLIFCLSTWLLQAIYARSVRLKKGDPFRDLLLKIFARLMLTSKKDRSPQPA